jgi:hypothetical protein
MKKLIVMMALATSLAACTDERKKAADALDKEVMQIHDEVMPKMGKVLTYRKRINNKIDSCSNQACKDSLQPISYALSKADEDMMQWMRNFERPEGLDTAEAYLTVQKQEIEKVSALVEEGLKNAEAVLGEE